MSEPNTVTAKHCWQSIGVYGDASCELLQTLAHCRRCPEYSKSGRHLLDREIPDSFTQEWTKWLATPLKQSVADSVSFLVFRLRNEWLALKTVFFDEALEYRQIHGIPFRTSNFLLGLANINGELLICIDPAEMLGLSKNNSEKNFFMMVVSNGRDRYVFPVEEIKGIFPIEPTIIKKPPSTVAKAGSSFSCGTSILDGIEIGILDEEKLFAALERSFVY